MRQVPTALAIALVAVTACTDAPTSAAPEATAEISPITARVEGLRHSSTPTSSVRWHRKAIVLFRARGGSGRTLTYLGLAQYRGVLAALKAHRVRPRPSFAGAAAGASVVVLKQFYPLDHAAIDAELAAQRAAPAGDEDEDELAAFDAGDAIGREIGAAVLRQASTDGFNLTDPGAAPVGPGFWVTNGTPAVRGNLGARPFFLRSASEIRPAPPPAFGSPDFLSALAETKSLAANRTPEQLAIVRKWVPFANTLFDSVAADLIDKYHRSEFESAAIFAYAGAADFDALIGCFEAKYHYWYIRPSQADPSISLGTGLPNHPSYPAAHSCDNGAWAGILSIAFPRERTMLEALGTEASTSRLLGGLHYRFDAVAGAALGRKAALLAVLRRGIE